MDSRRKGRRILNTRRRSSRRLQLTPTKKYYKDIGSDSEDSAGDNIPGERVAEESCRYLSQSSQQYEQCVSSRNIGAYKTSHHQKFKWVLQSDLMTKQLGKLFWDGGRDNDTTKDYGCLLATDVTLVSSEGDCVEAHKVVLILSCPYFRRLFTKLAKSLKGNDSGNTVLVLGNVGTTCLKNLIRFIYTGEIDVPFKEQKDFLKMGEFLGISGIKSVETKLDGKESQEAIKVHVIDKRIVSNDSDSADNEDSFKLKSSHDTTPSISCKQEPVDDGVSDEKDAICENIIATGGNDYINDDKDDQCSNFSDEIKPTASSSVRSRSKSTGSSNNETCRPGYEPKTLRGIWREIKPVSDEDLTDNWRTVQKKVGQDNYESIVYYCYHGARRCPARIKRITDDGEATWYSNQQEHTGHRESTFGLPVETKRFVVSMLEQGIRKPEKIFKAMRLLSMDLPSKPQLANFIMYTVRKGDQEFPFSKKGGPKRIRKYVPRDGPPKKRGRPRIDPATKMKTSHLTKYYPDKIDTAQQNEESTTSSINSTEVSRITIPPLTPPYTRLVTSFIKIIDKPSLTTSTGGNNDDDCENLPQDTAQHHQEQILHQCPSGFTLAPNVGTEPNYSYTHEIFPPSNLP